jgi:HEAT repeat protein
VRPACAQEPASSLQAQLISRLAAAEEEARMDAAVNLGALFTLAPGAAAEPAIAALGRALHNDSSPVVRALAARGLALAGDARAVPALLTALGRERERAVRKAIIYALAPHRDPQITAALIPLLKDKEVEIRATAAYALAEAADPQAASALIAVLGLRRKDEEAFARSEAARGLGRIGGSGAVAPLVAALTGEEAHEVRREATLALGRLASKRDTAAIEALRAATRAEDPYLSREAIAALAAINARP